MADPTAVNSQITDAVTQSSVTVLGSAGTAAASQAQQVGSHALALLMENATAAQQRGQAIADAVVAAGVRLIDAAHDGGGKRLK